MEEWDRDTSPSEEASDSPPGAPAVVPGILARLRMAQHALLRQVEQADAPLGSGEERDELLSILKQNLEELRGDRIMEPEYEGPKGSELADRFAGATGMVKGKMQKALPDHPWSQCLDLLQRLGGISDHYALLHALGIGSGDAVLAGMAWNHARRIHGLIIHERRRIYREALETNRGTGGGAESALKDALEEWNHSWDL